MWGARSVDNLIFFIIFIKKVLTDCKKYESIELRRAGLLALGSLAITNKRAKGA